MNKQTNKYKYKGNKMVHHTQISRKKNLDIIQGWIKEIPVENSVNQEALIRKIELVLGASKEKAKEYISIILGE
jgi:hypothetical protein